MVRTECKDRRYDRDKLQWNERCKVWQHEGLGHQLDHSARRWAGDQDPKTAKKVLRRIQSQQPVCRIGRHPRYRDRR
jgi:hypothetical protein